jgi:hypothetical protein
LRRRGGGNGAAADVGEALRLAAEPPPRRVRSDPGSIHIDAFAQAANVPALDDALVKKPPATKAMATAAKRLSTAFDRKNLDPDTVNFLDTRLKAVTDAFTASRSVPILPLLSLVDRLGPRPSRERLRVLGAALSAEPDSDDLAALGAKIGKAPPQPVATAFDLDQAETQIAAEFDPTAARPSIVDRVLSGVSDISGVVDGDPIKPVELTPELPLPAWQFLRDEAPEWLLPGTGTIDPDSVIALQTNPAFVDAFLLGLNAQIVGELRFRNYPLIPGWTPVRTFWNRANPASGAVEDDVVDIGSWPADTLFGAPAHQTPAAASADLVVLFDTALFREYPGTLVYLVPALRDAQGHLDWTKRPNFDNRQFPSFQGRISSEQTFFGFELDPELGKERWVVLEETVNGRRFFNARTKPAAVNAAHNGADLAVGTISPPRRVLIRGDVLLGGL